MPSTKTKTPSLVSRPTAVIIGAGASVDFGIPLGSELYDLAASSLKKCKREWEEAVNEKWISSTPALLAYFQGVQPFTELVKLSTNEEGGASLTLISRLLELMEMAPVYSLDTLALENPEYLKICKLLTAQIIADKVNSSLLSKRDGRIQPKEWEFAKRTIRIGGETKNNWINLFVSMMRSAKRARPDTKFNFISFNYDGIVENVMRKLWALPSEDIGQFDDVARFCYPHGRLPWVTGTDNVTSLNSAEYESSILFAHNKEHKEGFPDAIAAIKASQDVISLGFHFAPENINSLSLSEIAKGKNLTYQNYAGNRGLDERISRLPFAYAKPFSGSIADAVVQGYCGELPS